MTPELKQRVQIYVIDAVDGGVTTSITELIDNAIKWEYFTEQEFRTYEREILVFIDSNIFKCEECDWTLPRDEESDEAMFCKDCSTISEDE